MSDLAFNVHGERFEVPAAAELWRVRRFKASGRGTPEVVFGTDGLPLVVPIDADIAEFRQLVGSTPGRYRLDAVDAQQRPCDGGIGAYIQLSDGPIEATDAASPSVLLERVIQANTEMVKVITDKFAAVMESAATLLRAADGAGLPAREPLVLRNALPPSPVDASPSPGDVDPDGSLQVLSILQTMLPQVMPLLTHAIHTKVLGLTTEQSIAMVTGAPVRTSGRSAAVEPAARAPTTAPAETAKRSPPASDVGTRLDAIQKLLTAEERDLVRQAIQGMTAETLSSWTTELLALSPEDAAHLVRSRLKSGDATS